MKKAHLVVGATDEQANPHLNGSWRLYHEHQKNSRKMNNKMEEKKNGYEED